MISARLRQLGVPVLAVVLLAACGGTGGSEGGAIGSADATAAAPDTSSEPAGGGSIDDAPPAGQARIEVDGRSFSADVHTCDVRERTYSVGAETEVDGVAYELGSNGANTGTRWTGQAGLTPRADGVTYVSVNGTVTVDGSSVMYVGQFDRSGDGPLADVGEGRLLATC